MIFHVCRREWEEGAGFSLALQGETWLFWLLQLPRPGIGLHAFGLLDQAGSSVETEDGGQIPEVRVISGGS